MTLINFLHLTFYYTSFSLLIFVNVYLGHFFKNNGLAWFSFLIGISCAGWIQFITEQIEKMKNEVKHD